MCEQGKKKCTCTSTSTVFIHQYVFCVSTKSCLLLFVLQPQVCIFVLESLHLIVDSRTIHHENSIVQSVGGDCLRNNSHQQLVNTHHTHTHSFYEYLLWVKSVPANRLSFSSNSFICSAICSKLLLRSKSFFLTSVHLASKLEMSMLSRRDCCNTTMVRE